MNSGNIKTQYKILSQLTRFFFYSE